MFLRPHCALDSKANGYEVLTGPCRPIIASTSKNTVPSLLVYWFGFFTVLLLARIDKLSPAQLGG